MKTTILNKAMQVASGLIVAALLFSGCTKDDDITTGGLTSNEESNSVFNETLSSQEIDGLMYMVENEKLLRDYFTKMNDKYNLAVFKHIAESEQRHLSQLSVKFTRYDLENPTDFTEEGEFVNPFLQQYYNDLLSQGGGSAYTALSAGIAKVGKDIEDLPNLINQLQGNPDIKQVYSVILIESQSNLDALVAEMKARTILSSKPQAPVADF